MRDTISGFSVIELVIVLAIVAILATVATPRYKSFVHRKNVAEAVTLLESLSDKAVVYYERNNIWPRSMTEISSFDPSVSVDQFAYSSNTVHSVRLGGDSSKKGYVWVRLNPDAIAARHNEPTVIRALLTRHRGRFRKDLCDESGLSPTSNAVRPLLDC